MRSRERHYLLDILIEAKDAVSFVSGLTYEMFIDNTMNPIVHEYEDVNLPIGWDIVTLESPKVVSALDPLFPERPKQ